MSLPQIINLFSQNEGTSAKLRHLPQILASALKWAWIPQEYIQSPASPRAIFKLATIKHRAGRKRRKMYIQKYVVL